MAEADYFYSSDIEIPQERIDELKRHDARNKRFGKRSIAEITAHAAEDRRRSKILEKSLRWGHGSPQALDRQQTWLNRFEAVREKSLLQDISKAPDGETIRRFASIIVVRVKRHLKGHFKGRPPMNKNTLKQGIDWILDFCDWRWGDMFKFTSQDRKKLVSMYDELQRQGLAGVGRASNRSWVGFLLNAHMTRSLYTRALTQGTVNMDLDVNRVLTLNLLAANGSRCGDIALPQSYTPLQAGLYWTDLELVIDTKAPVPTSITPKDEQHLEELYRHLRLRVTLLFTKGRRDKPNDNVTYEVRPLNDPTCNTSCLVATILIHALRHGYVHHTDVRQVLLSAWNRRDKRVRWTHPDRPVVSVRSTHGKKSTLDLTELATTQQVRATVKDAGLNAGVIDRITPHSFRRGHATEVAHMPGRDTFAGAASIGIAYALSHKPGTHAAGSTARYVPGGVDHPIYNDRHKLAFTTPFGPKLAAGAFDAPRLLPSNKIDEYLADNPDSSPNARNKASVAIRAQAVEDWRIIQGEDAAPVQPSTKASNQVAAATNSTAASEPSAVMSRPLRVQTESEMNSNASSVAASPQKRLSRKRALSEDRLDTAQSPHIARTEDSSDDGSVFVPDNDPGGYSGAEEEDDGDGEEPVLAEMMTTAYGFQSGNTDITPDEELDDMASELALNASADEPSTVLDQDSALDFITSISRYVIIKNDKFERALSGEDTPAKQAKRQKTSVSGNSRDPPTPFVFACDVTEGCTFSTTNKCRLDRHKLDCGPEVVAKQRKKACKAKEKKHKDDEDVALDDEDEQPKWCCPHGCNGGKPYKSKTVYNSHMSKNHYNPKTNITCPQYVQGKCKEEGVTPGGPGPVLRLVWKAIV